MPHEVEFRILGPLEVRVDGRRVAVPGARQRALLCALLQRPGEVVPPDRLINDVFGETPPAEARNALQTYVTRLRQALGPAADLIVTRPPGYLVDLSRAVVDAARFADLLAKARAHETAAAALALLDQALALWRGPAFAEFAETFARAEALRLEELRLAAREDRAALLLHLDRVAEATAALDALVAEQPWRERAVELLITSLARSGRTVEALAAYGRYRDRLRDDLGLDPSPALQQLEQEVLRGQLQPGRGKSLAPARRALPTRVTSLVGRDHELAAIRGLLSAGRLVTLVGPGGVGKTRLAREVVAAEQDPWWADLAALRDGQAVPPAVADAVSLDAQPGSPLLDTLRGWARSVTGLLVLDNCEHLLSEVAGLVARLLSACPGTRVLVTTRERLGLAGERLVVIEPLLLVSDAVALFRDRARLVDPDFDADASIVADLCARLDGLPLAIELAAARSAALGADGLLAAVENSSRLLSGGRGADQRHQSLQTVIGWSHDLLDEEARVLFRRLAVFAGGFDLDAAVAVSADDRAAVADVLGRLVDKSLVIHEPAAGRWRLLDTIRAFAAAQLDTSGERDEIQERHLCWAAAAAIRLEQAPAGARGGGWRGEFDAVAGDLRAALAAAADRPGALPHQLARSLGHLAFARRFLLESVDHYRTAAELAPTAAEAADDLRNAAHVTFVSTTSGPETFGLLLASAERAGTAGDGNAHAVALCRAVETAGRYQPVSLPSEGRQEQLRHLLEQASAAGDPQDPLVAAWLAGAAAWTTRSDTGFPDLALAQTAAAAARATGDPVRISVALDAVSFALLGAGRFREAHQLTRERLSLLATVDQDDPYAAAEIEDSFISACLDGLRAGDLPAALSAVRRLPADDLLGSHSYIAMSMQIPPLVLTGDLDTGLRYATRMWDGWQRAGRSPSAWMVPAVASAALAYRLRGDQQGFAVWRARVLEVVGITDPSHALHLAPVAFLDARAALHTGELADAAALVDRAFADFRGNTWAHPYARAVGAELAVVAGLPDAAERLAAAASTTGHNAWAAACLARATGRLNQDPDAYAAAVAGFERIGASLERAYTLLLLPTRASEGHADLTARGLPPPPGGGGV